MRVRWRPFRLPLRRSFDTADGQLDVHQGVLLEFADASGASGIGEATCEPSIGTGSLEDVLNLLKQRAHSLLGVLPSEGALSSSRLLIDDGPGVATLKCAVDVALLDLEAQAIGVSIADLLTNRPARSILVNAVIGDAAPEDVAMLGVDAVTAGYRVLKLKVGARPIDQDLDRVRALRAACPGVVLRLDANGAWSEQVATDAIDKFARLGVELIEQPVPSEAVEALARVREKASFCIAADEAVASEHGVMNVLKLRAADVIVLKPMLLGGVRPSLDLARRAAETGIGSFSTTTFDSSVGIAASLHLAAALSWDGAQGLSTGDHLGADIVLDPLRPVGGRLDVPGPGIGVVVDGDALDKFAVADWFQVPH